MLLFLDQEHDLHAEWVEAECQRREVPYLRLCTERFPLRVQTSTWLEDGRMTGKICTEEQEIRLEDIVGVWYRRPEPPELHPDMPEGYREFARSECVSNLTGLYQALYDRRWVSRFDRIVGANHKIYQMRLAGEMGFSTAPTLVTNDPDDTRKFFQQCGGRMIYKPMRFELITDEQGSEYGIYTSIVTEEHIEQCLESVSVVPCLFQALVDKSYELRVNVIGDRVWSAAIHSQESEDTQLDFRLDAENLRHEPIHLSEELEALCLEMTHRLGLRMSNIDFIVTPEGEHVFLELNPNGQFAWIEDLTGLPLTTALVDELLGVDTLADHPYLTQRSLTFEPQTAFKERQTA